MSNRTEATLRKHRQQPPGDYSHCACSRLHPEPRILLRATTFPASEGICQEAILYSQAFISSVLHA